MSQPLHKLARLIVNWGLARLERIDARLNRTGGALPSTGSPPRSSERMASLVILNWRRPDNVQKILDRYVAYTALDDILVWNNNGTAPFRYNHPKVRCINSDELGLNTRWLACLVARHPCIVVHDDDLLCDEGTINTLIEHHDRRPDRSYTLHGRNPTSANEYAEKVDHVTTPTECDMHLTRATCVNRQWVPCYFEALAAMALDIDPARGGGEDIVFSYAVRQATGHRPMVVPGHYEDLGAAHALANRNGSQVDHRTRIMRTCQRWLEEHPGRHSG